MSKNEQKAAKKGKREQKGAYPEKTSKAVLTKRHPDKTSEPVQLKKMSHKTVLTKRLLNCQVDQMTSRIVHKHLAMLWVTMCWGGPGVLNFV